MLLKTILTPSSCHILTLICVLTSILPTAGIGRSLSLLSADVLCLLSGTWAATLAALNRAAGGKKIANVRSRYFQERVAETPIN